MENIKLFKKALKFVLKWEGGYGHNPNDKGGATNKGITQYTYNAWLKEHKLQLRWMQSKKY
jgi:lysozyme family protein